MTKFSENAHHYLGTKLQVTYTDTFGETAIGTLDGIDTRYQRVHVDGCVTYDCKPHFRSLHKLTQLIRVEGESEPFVPMERLLQKALFGVFRVEEPLSEITLYDEGNSYGIVAYGYDLPSGIQRFGFTFNCEPEINHVGFDLSSNSNRLNINQLELFQQLLSWDFNLWLKEGEFMEIDETTNTPEAGENEK